MANELSKKYDVTVFTLYGNGELEGQLYTNVKHKTLYKEKYNDLSNFKKKMIPLKLLLMKNLIYKKHVKKDYDVEIAFLEGPITRLFSVKNKKTRNTIEFRSPNGTFEPVIWQNNLNLFTKMIEKVKTIDVEKLYYDYFSNFSISVNEYNKIYFEDAIRFADLIFDKNIDKMYFLRQYLKNNDVSNRYVKTKRFVK